MSKSKNSNIKTLIVAFTLCLVCSILVSGVAVGLKPKQLANAALDRNKNILIAANQYDEKTDTMDVVPERFNNFDVYLVNLQTGKFATEDELSQYEMNSDDVATYDVATGGKNPSMSVELSKNEDIANIGRVPVFGKVYIAREGDAIKSVVMPIYGYGLWGTIYGFLTLEGDINTIQGVSFYQHQETPGLGALIEEAPWRDGWKGKQTYDDNGNIIFGITKAGQANQHQVNGISGATLTSRGVNNMVQFWLGDGGYRPFLSNLKAGKAGE